MTQSMITYRTVFESTQALPASVCLGHGENADLMASVRDNGEEVDLTGFQCRAVYQPWSKFGTSDWYECPAEIDATANAGVAHWSHVNDNGDDAVCLWIRFEKDGSVCYPALYKMKLFQTPGFQPSAITPVPPTLDFSMFTLVNAPWAEESEVQGVETRLGAVEDVLASPPWLPLAGGTMAGNVYTGHDIVHRTSRTVTWKHLVAHDDTEDYFVGDVTITYDASRAADLLDLDADDIPVRLTGSLASTGEEGTVEGVLTAPSEYQAGQVAWELLEDGESIGGLTFAPASGGGFPSLVYGDVHGDYIMASNNYGPDTTEVVVEDKPYIYDPSGLATKAEVQEAQDTATRAAATAERVESRLPYSRTNRVITSASGLVSPENRQEVGLLLSGTTSLRVAPPAPVSFRVTDFIVDIDATSNTANLAITVSTLSQDEPWALAIDEDEQSLSTVLTVAPGKKCRYYFSELGLDKSGKPLLHVSRKLYKTV